MIEKLSSATHKAVTSKDVEENFAKQGATPTPSTSAQLRGQIAEETRRWAAVVRDAGIKIE